MLPALFTRVDFLTGLLAAVLAVLLTAVPETAQAEEGEFGRQPVVIRSRTMEADNVGRRALFLGDVIAETASGTINADRMEVFYSEETGGIVRIECTGNVRLLRDSKTIIAETAVYHEAERMIDFRGEPRILDGRNMVTGSVIRYYPDEDRAAQVAEMKRIGESIEVYDTLCNRVAETLRQHGMDPVRDRTASVPRLVYYAVIVVAVVVCAIAHCRVRLFVFLVAFLLTPA